MMILNYLIIMLKKKEIYLIKCLKEYLSIYIHSKEIYNILLKIIYYNRQIIYSQNDLKIINKRIINIKSKIQKENIYMQCLI